MHGFMGMEEKWIVNGESVMSKDSLNILKTETSLWVEQSCNWRCTYF